MCFVFRLKFRSPSAEELDSILLHNTAGAGVGQGATTDSYWDSRLKEYLVKTETADNDFLGVNKIVVRLLILASIGQAITSIFNCFVSLSFRMGSQYFTRKTTRPLFSR
jgi:hypothetical protein